MNCPCCRDRELSVQNAAGVGFHRCTECHGFWLEALEFRKLLNLRPATLLSQDRQNGAGATPIKPGAKREPRECPRCGGTTLILVNNRERPGNYVESCTVCFGVWLDAGALHRMSRGGLMAKLRRWLPFR